jgi:hypothetical protein
MIYVIWTDGNGQVLHGWDSCTSETGNKVTYQDTPIIHGPVPVGQETTPQAVRLNISKFPGASTPPTQPITNCVFKLVSYYGSDGVTYSIPPGYSDTYSFCGDLADTDLFYEGYSGSESAEADIQKVGVEWPALDSPCGLMISQNGCSYTVMRFGSEEGIPLVATAGGSESNTDGQIDPNRYAEILFKVKFPDSTIYEGGAIQILTSLDFIFTE